MTASENASTHVLHRHVAQERYNLSARLQYRHERAVLKNHSAKAPVDNRLKVASPIERRECLCRSLPGSQQVHLSPISTLENCTAAIRTWKKTYSRKLTRRATKQLEKHYARGEKRRQRNRSKSATQSLHKVPTSSICMHTPTIPNYDSLFQTLYSWSYVFVHILQKLSLSLCTSD